MSLDTSSFDKPINGCEIEMVVTDKHPLIKLGQQLPWDEILSIVLPDLKNTEKKLWWRGRPLQVRMHLSLYLLQQIFDLRDRQA